MTGAWFQEQARLPTVPSGSPCPQTLALNLTRFLTAHCPTGPPRPPGLFRPPFPPPVPLPSSPLLGSSPVPREITTLSFHPFLLPPLLFLLLPHPQDSLVPDPGLGLQPVWLSLPLHVSPFPSVLPRRLLCWLPTLLTRDHCSSDRVHLRPLQCCGDSRLSP